MISARRIPFLERSHPTDDPNISPRLHPSLLRESGMEELEYQMVGFALNERGWAITTPAEMGLWTHW